MGGVEKLGVSQAAEGTLRDIRPQDPLTKDSLVQPPLDRCQCILAPQYEIDRVDDPGSDPLIPHLSVCGHDELLQLRLLTDDPGPSKRRVDARRDSKEPDELFLCLQCPSKRDVVIVPRIGPAPFVSEVTVEAFGVLIRPVLRTCSVRREDRQCDIEAADNLDSLRLMDEWNRPASEFKPLEVPEVDWTSGSLGKTLDVQTSSFAKFIVLVPAAHARSMP
jgi:hypothetical protein